MNVLHNIGTKANRLLDVKVKAIDQFKTLVWIVRLCETLIRQLKTGSHVYRQAIKKPGNKATQDEAPSPESAVVMV